MHVHAVARVTASYEHIDPEAVGNERRILVSELSGRSNIMALTAKHNLQDDRELMDKILAQVVELENAGLSVRGGRGVVRPVGQASAPARSGRTSSG